MSERVLPEGWREAKLGEISTKPQYGYTTKASGHGSIKFLRTTDITKSSLNWDSVPFCHDEPDDLDRFRLGKGDIVISRAGSIGYSHLLKEVPEKAVFASYLIRFKPLSGIDSRYLKRFLESPYYWKQLKVKAAGNALQNVNAKKLADLDVCVPALEEQVVIVGKLNELLAQVSNLKARLDAIPNILNRFRQSVLAAAVNRELTENDETDRDINSIETTLGELLEVAFDGPFGSKLKTSDYTDSGVGVVRLENIRHLNFDDKKETYIGEKKYESLKGNTLRKHDVLFSSFVDEQVRVCLFPFDDKVFINKADCFCLRANRSKVTPEFLMLLLASHESYLQIKNHVQGVTRPRVNLKVLKSLVFKVPSLTEQKEIIRRVDQLFAFADQVEQQVKNAQARVNKLTQSILAKAFRGEFTAEWRAANPELISGENCAEALLERIKAEKAKQMPTQKRRRSNASAVKAGS